jgi:hypothetical protein
LYDKTYFYRVQAVCSDGGTSDWSDVFELLVYAPAVEDYLQNSVSLYPNPAREVLNVQCTMYNVQWDGATVEVFDVYGKLLQTVEMSSDITILNVSGLADGMYFVRVSTEAGSVTKTFVKR